MGAVRTVVTGLLLLSMLATAGCGAKLLVAASYPAEIALPSEIKTIAVTPFVGQDPQSLAGAEMASGLLASRLNATLGQSGQYTIIERGNLKDIMKELDLADAGITDTGMAARAGKLLNADAIIIGSVQVQASESVETKTETTYYKGIPTTNVVQKLRRTGMVSMTSKMVRPETAQVVISKTTSHNYDSNLRGGLAMFLNDNSDVPPPEIITRTMLEECVTDFYNTISPHVDYFEVELAAGKTEMAKAGLDLAKAGMFQEAAVQFEESAKAQPLDHGSIYDLGVMQMLLGDAAAAKENVDKALRMKTDKKYIQVSQQLKAAMATGQVTFRAATGEEAVTHKSRQKMLKARS